MKKVLSFICLMLTFLFCMTGCGGNDSPPKTVYENLNSLIAKESTSITLTVKTTTDGETLNGSYLISKQDNVYTVNYSYEKLNTFEEVGGVITQPTEYKSTVTGNMKISNGTIIEQDGEASNVSIESLTVSGLTFNESYFSNVVNENNTFKADVNNPNGFMGYDVTLSNLKVEIAYTTEKISSIKLTYSTSLSSVELMYNL